MGMIPPGWVHLGGNTTPKNGIKVVGRDIEEPIACPSPTPRPDRDVLKELFNQRIRTPHTETEASDIYYVTSRELRTKSASCSNASFGVNPGKTNVFGFCRLNVPKKSRVGIIQPTGDPRADSHNFYRIQGHRSILGDQFFTQIKSKNPESILLFVHGFNVKFEEAIMRTAQISYDLKYQGLPIVYSWPAGAEEGLAASLINKTYEKNLAAAKQSQKDAVQFFRELSALKIPIHVIVHSMGHQVIVPSLTSLATEISEPFIDELVLNAPDLSVEDFHNAASALTKVARRVTVYCSFNDNAIAASESYNSNRRLGACATADGIDVINVSEVDAPTLGLGLGHSYYSSRPIITDVYQLLLGLEAEKRLFLRRSEPNSVENFYLRP